LGGFASAQTGVDGQDAIFVRPAVKGSATMGQAMLPTHRFYDKLRVLVPAGT